MSRNRKGLKADGSLPETLAQLLGTDDPERQIGLVRNLIGIAIERQVSFTVLYKPHNGQYQLLHSDNAAYADLKAALEAGLEYLHERRIRAQMEQQSEQQDAGGAPAAPPDGDQPDGGGAGGGQDPTGPADPASDQEHDPAGG